MTVTVEQAKDIAKMAYIYAYPMMENYKTMYNFAIWDDRQYNSQYKKPFNEIVGVARLFTPDDTTIVTPNSDTPYSSVWMDLRCEPLVLSIPQIDPGRYYSVQLIDLYTYDFDYIGTRANREQLGQELKFIVAGPNWNGDTPEGITRVIHSETEFVYAIYRTQLFGGNDVLTVQNIQDHYTVQPLSQFLGESAPPPAAELTFPCYDPKATQSIHFIAYLNFLLQFCPTHPSEQELMEEFALIGIGPGLPFNNLEEFTHSVQQAVVGGIQDGQKEIDDRKKSTTNSAGLFGTRDFLGSNYEGYLKRAVGAAMGIYGNVKEEALYPGYQKDADQQPLTGQKAYTMYFPAGQLPPVDAFWSVTMYELPSQFLVANPINRYLINSVMVDNHQVTMDEHGGLTLYIQHDSPGNEHESNWLPAPAGPFYLVMRLYLPREEAQKGTWQAPPLQRVG